jgi:NDP-sugar pyrophosphorylase family protein
VVEYDKRAPTDAMRWIDYGLGGLRADALGLVGEHVSDLAELYHELAHRDQLFGFAATERFYEIGTPAALAETDTFLATVTDDARS